MPKDPGRLDSRERAIRQVLEQKRTRAGLKMVDAKAGAGADLHRAQKQAESKWPRVLFRTGMPAR